MDNDNVNVTPEEIVDTQKKLRGIGYTRKNKKQSSIKRKMAKQSRRINRKKGWKK